jgi:hypothetical protein
MLTPLRFIHNRVITGIQWMVRWLVLVHSGPAHLFIHNSYTLSSQVELPNSSSKSGTNRWLDHLVPLKEKKPLKMYPNKTPKLVKFE